MRDIACAANGSDQTLCNYFSSKEHLIFDQQQEFEERILRAAIGTSSGMPLSETLRQGASRLLHDLSKNVGKVNGIPGEAATGPELRRVWIERNARHADRLPDALLETG
jgi:AcrR family transcriptional regulator